MNDEDFEHLDFKEFRGRILYVIRRPGESNNYRASEAKFELRITVEGMTFSSQSAARGAILGIFSTRQRSATSGLGRRGHNHISTRPRVT